MNLNGALALTNAALTTASALCMTAAVRAVRRKDVPRHRAWMIAAVSLSALFLIAFCTRIALFGFARFQGQGAWKIVYLILFFGHEPMAVISVPLALCALVLGLLRSDAAHREVARYAYPIWLFASITGVALYFLLYLFPGQ